MSTPSDSPPAADVPKAAAPPPKVKGPAVDKKAAKAARRAQKVAERPGEAPLAATPTASTPLSKNASLSVPEESGSAPKPRRASNSGQARPQLIRGAAAASSSKPSAAAAAVAAPPAAPAGPTLHPLVANIPGSKLSSTTSVANVHPAIIKLGLQLKEGTIRGANARLIAGLNGLKQVILSYRTPPSTTLSRDLTAHLSPQIAHLTTARPMPIGLGNAIRWLKYEISTVDIDEAEADTKEMLAEKIDMYIKERVTLADEVIVAFGKEKIKDGSVVLTYARSSIVEKLLVSAFNTMKNDGQSFSVILIDSAPLFEGRSLLPSLTAHGIPCTYGLLPSLPSLLARTDLVLLGTNAVLGDGACYSRAGTASVAMLAKGMGKPVLVCSETYKFVEKIQLDPLVANELGDSDALLQTPPTHALSKLSDTTLPSPMYLGNLLYDHTSPTYISGLLTEYGYLPPGGAGAFGARSGGAMGGS